MSLYVVDSNFFIEAHRATYPLDVFHSYWTKVAELAQRGKIISIDKVKAEIFDHQDELKKWCESNLPEDFFKDSSGLIAEYKRVAWWAQSRKSQYKEIAISEFLDADNADAWLVTYALADTRNRVVVTREISQPDAKRKIKIPDACQPFSVSFASPIEMFRGLGVSI